MFRDPAELKPLPIFVSISVGMYTHYLYSSAAIRLQRAVYGVRLPHAATSGYGYGSTASAALRTHSCVSRRDCITSEGKLRHCVTPCVARSERV